MIISMIANIMIIRMTSMITNMVGCMEVNMGETVFIKKKTIGINISSTYDKIVFRRIGSIVSSFLGISWGFGRRL